MAELVSHANEMPRTAEITWRSISGSSGMWSATLDALLPLLHEKRVRRHLDHAVEHYQKSRKGLDELAVGKPG